jgi:hypothetical protein
MFLSQALTKIRNLKSKVARVDLAITGCVTHYEDSEPEYSYAEECKTRSTLLDEIRDLKTRVLLTNAVTDVVWQKDTMTLANLILVNADLRSEMAFVTKQLAIALEDSEGWRSKTRSKDDIKKVYAEGYSKNKLRAELEFLESSKEQMDGLMASVNNSTALV